MDRSLKHGMHKKHVPKVHVRLNLVLTGEQLLNIRTEARGGLQVPVNDSATEPYRSVHVHSPLDVFSPRWGCRIRLLLSVWVFQLVCASWLIVCALALLLSNR